MMQLAKTLHTRLLRNTLGATQRLNLVRLVGGLLPDKAASVLDIGCGNGLFSRDLMAARPYLNITGVETRRNLDCPIQQCIYSGTDLPFADKCFDYVLLINVLHHTNDPAHVLSEAARVARHSIIIKDHYADSRMDFATLVLMEWLGNAFAGINQPYRFFSQKEWTDLFSRQRLKSESKLTRFVSYNALVDLFFGRNLHFIEKLARP